MFVLFGESSLIPPYLAVYTLYLSLFFHPENNQVCNFTAHTKTRIQRVMIIMPVIQFFGLLIVCLSSTFLLQSSNTSLGISFNAKYTPNGTRIKSSRYPKIGMKSGIKSIGLKHTQQQAL